MGRRSVRERRRAEILDAFADLANERGLHQCSLRAIAERVGVTMPLLLHHFESRDEMVSELIVLVTSEFQRGYESGRGPWSFEGDPDALLDFFFAGGFRRLVGEYDPLFADLLAESNRDPELRERFRQLYRTMQRFVEAELAAIAPDADDDTRRLVAYALICLLESNEMFLRMGFRDGRSERARAAAAVLLQQLRTDRPTGSVLGARH